MPRVAGEKLAADLERFAEQWISNPAARLEFAQLVERVASSTDPFQMRSWIAQMKDTAKRLGIK